VDKRCPRKLTEYPTEWCELAVLRLKLIRSAAKELTDEEEQLLRGCNFALACQSANYCFFKYCADMMNESPRTDIEIARMLNISVDSLKKIEKKAIVKMQDSDFIRDVKRCMPDGESIIDYNRDDSEGE
jgi:DNA-directed RNA polymerase specialized sigma subunit